MSCGFSQLWEQFRVVPRYLGVAQLLIPHPIHITHPAFSELTSNMVVSERFSHHGHTSLRQNLSYMLFGKTWAYCRGIMWISEGK